MTQAADPFSGLFYIRSDKERLGVEAAPSFFAEHYSIGQGKCVIFTHRLFI